MCFEKELLSRLMQLSDVKVFWQKQKEETEKSKLCFYKFNAKITPAEKQLIQSTLYLIKKYGGS